MTDRPLYFVTGATGFVGAAVARALQAQGASLRLLCRPHSNPKNIQDIGNAEIVRGDLADPSSYAAALAGCTGLYHVAADYRIWVPDAAQMNKINIEGTEALLTQAHQAGIKRMVYTSSVATLGLYKDGTPANEELPVTLNDMVGVYKRSKFLAEEKVRYLVQEKGLPCVIVLPSTPIGPGDVKPTPTGRIIRDAACGKIPAFVDTGLNVVHVDDVAHGHLLAFEKGRLGERYILGGENMPLSAILNVVATYVRRKPPTIKLPRAPLYPLAVAAELWGRLSGKEPLLTCDGLRMSRKKMYFTSAKAEKELGYRSRPGVEALHAAIDWFAANGYLGDATPSLTVGGKEMR